MSHYTSVNCLAKWWDMYDNCISTHHASKPKDYILDTLTFLESAMLKMATKEELRLCHDYLTNDDIDNITGVDLDE